MCVLRIDGKTIDKKETSDYEIWYDSITDKIYDIEGFRKIEIKILTNKKGIRRR